MELFFEKCTKKGDLAYFNAEADKTETITLYQKEDCLYLVSKEEPNVIKIFPLIKAIAVVKQGAYSFVHCLEFLYESPETKNNIQFYSNNITELSDWVGSTSSCSKFGDFLEKYVLGQEIGKGKFSVVYSCVRHIFNHNYRLRRNQEMLMQSK